MIRHFKFEDEIHHQLACVPMAVRRKLDRVGVKVSLEQWQALAQHERLAICHLPTASGDECEALRTFLEESVRARGGGAAKRLPEDAMRAAEPPATAPPLLIERARAAGVAIDQAAWERLDGDERYALMKLGAGDVAGHNLGAALRELIGRAGR